MKKNYAYTLLELMATIAIIAIVAMIAYPSYSAYVKRADVANAQKEISRLVYQLERHKSRNFTYFGFDAAYLYANELGVTSPSFNTTTQRILFPIGSNATNYQYEIILVDATSDRPLTDPSSTGQSWAIKAFSRNNSNFSLLTTSTGIKCKNATSATITTNTSCGSGSQEW